MQADAEAAVEKLRTLSSPYHQEVILRKHQEAACFVLLTNVPRQRSHVEITVSTLVGWDKKET